MNAKIVFQKEMKLGSVFRQRQLSEVRMLTPKCHQEYQSKDQQDGRKIMGMIYFSFDGTDMSHCLVFSSYQFSFNHSSICRKTQQNLTVKSKFSVIIYQQSKKSAKHHLIVNQSTFFMNLRSIKATYSLKAPYVYNIQANRRRKQMKIHRNLTINKLKLGLAGKRQSIINLKQGELLAFTNIAPQQDFILTNDFKEKQFKLNDEIDTRDSLPSIQKESNDKLRKRSYSTMIKPFQVLNTKVPSLQISPSLKPNSPNPYFQSSKSFECDDKIQEIASLLRKNFIINSSNKLYYSIRKDHLINLLQQVISSLSLTVKQDKNPSFPFLVDIFTSLSLEIQKKERRIKISRFQESKTINCMLYAGLEYQRECATIQSILSKLNEKVKSSQNQLSHLQTCIEALNKQKADVIHQISQLSRQQHTIRSLISQSTIVLEDLNNRIASQQQSLKKFTDISHSYQNFVNVQQNNKLVAMASEKYKEIESDIYDYASYLQCNQLASSLSYQPLQIQCITADIDSKLREVNKSIIQKEEMSIKEKEILMRDFLLEAIDKFKKRDEEQKGFIAFKTKCIRTFIANMKKWLQNWTLKQEYLTNLRNQFASVSTSLVTLIESTSTVPFDKLREHQQNLLELFTHLQENYKMGNSFY